MKQIFVRTYEGTYKNPGNFQSFGDSKRFQT